MNEEKINEIFDGFADPEINDSNIIEQIIKLICGNNTQELRGLSDVNPRLVQAVGYWLVSTFSKRNFAMGSIAKAKVFNKTLDKENFELKTNEFFNLWFMILAKSRVGRKTVTMSFIEQVIEEVEPDLPMLSIFTPQALIDYLSDKWVETKLGEIWTTATWFLDECSTYFDMLKKADFLAGSDGLLSKLYDSKNAKDLTISRGDKVIKNPYFTGLLASTPDLPTSFTDKMYKQGFLNRWCIIHETSYSTKPERFDMLTDEELELGNKITLWVDTLNSLVLPTVIKFDSKAIQIYREFSHRIDKAIIKDNLGLTESYFSNLPKMLTKLAGVYQIAELSQDELLNIDMEIEINENSILVALDYLKYLWHNFQQCYEISRNPKEMDLTSIKNSVSELLARFELAELEFIKDKNEVYEYDSKNRRITELRKLKQKCQWKEFDSIFSEAKKMGFLRELPSDKEGLEKLGILYKGRGYSAQLVEKVN
ncbi:MAG: DUF3987 domain-containing protein [Candidatus Heimdallarchaeota archaeon]|nr:DUF3987 domain-containing protein [Candidatus Heimdallarchaeota archaeon]